MTAPLHLETDRLVLSPPTPADAEAIFERYASDAEVTRYVGWPRHRTVEDTREFLAFSLAQWERLGAGPYLIRARDSNQLVGGTGLDLHEAEAMTGFVLAKDAWGKGYATESLRAMIAVARRIGLRRIYALCHPDHRRSQHVLEKCGFEQDPAWATPAVLPNLAPGLPQPVLCYARALEDSAYHRG
jgi:ribosomal-protein-alanine N-acetyltransferase